MKKTIYCLYACDAWKMRSSYAVIMATTDEQKLQKQIRHELRNNNMQFNGRHGKRAVAEFMKSGCDYTRLKYGDVDWTWDGELIG